ncbi:MAG: protein phosphatase 2C domain-containing protein, partial [Jatrophihabitantaceae bacterium]
MLSVRWAAGTDTGRQRPANEDSFYCCQRLFAVADGMGGHAAGEQASRLALAAIAPVAEAPITVDGLAEAIARANHDILQAGRQRPDWFGLGTTVTGIAVVEVAGRDHWGVFNVGDSRSYRFADGALSQLTVDHSAVQEMLTAGLISPAEARSHPQRNVVTRYLGSQPAPRPDIAVYEPVPGERFLICSDGLTNELVDAELAQVFTAY